MREFGEDDMPIQCEGCGEWICLTEGNGCSECAIVFCEKCVDEPFGYCPKCKPAFEDEGEEE